MRRTKFAAVAVALVAAAFAAGSVVDNTGRRVVEPELTDAQRSKHQANPPRVGNVGTVDMGARKADAIIQHEAKGDAAVTSALKPDDRRIDGLQALQMANSDLAKAGQAGWWRLALYSLGFVVLGFGVLFWVRNWADKNVPPPPAKRKKRA